MAISFTSIALVLLILPKFAFCFTELYCFCSKKFYFHTRTFHETDKIPMGASSSRPGSIWCKIKSERLMKEDIMQN